MTTSPTSRSRPPDSVIALDQADLRQGKKQLILDGTTFHVMGLFGDHATRLYDYVSQSAASSKS